MEQAPGPRGSPQEPHAPTGPAEAEVLFVATANMESLGARVLLWHLGQDAFSSPKISVSNSWSHALHRYSKIGMFGPSIVGPVLAVIKYKGPEDFFYSRDLIQLIS